MDERLNRIEEKLDVQADHLLDIKTTLARNTVILDEHQRRSLASEKRLDLVEKDSQMIHVTFKLIAAIGAFILFVVEFLHYSGIFKP